MNNATQTIRVYVECECGREAVRELTPAEARDYIAVLQAAVDNLIPHRDIHVRGGDG